MMAYKYSFTNYCVEVWVKITTGIASTAIQQRQKCAHLNLFYRGCANMGKETDVSKNLTCVIVDVPKFKAGLFFVCNIFLDKGKPIQPLHSFRNACSQPLQTKVAHRLWYQIKDINGTDIIRMYSNLMSKRSEI